MEESQVPPAKRQKLAEAAEQPASGAPSVLLQLPKYVQHANEAELVHLKEKHGIVENLPAEEAKAVAPSQSSTEAASSNKPFQKRKTGLVFGYLGEKYQGLQRNPGAITIEALLEMALSRVGAIASVNAHQWDYGLDWMRAARTDKGVSAACNLISLNMLQVPDVVNKLNEILPEDIRIFGTYLVPKSFSAKDKCGGRIYEYRVPTYVFRPSKRHPSFSTEFASNWTFGESERARVNEVLSAFLGTHRFHNFTIKMKYHDPQTERYIMSFECSAPYTIEGMEWVTLRVKGQSFVLHQIRKMVAVTIAVVRDGQSTDVIKALFKPAKADNVTMAPSEGLCLAAMDFERYNEKISMEKDSSAEPITLQTEQPLIDAFKNNIIIPYLAKYEKEKSMFKNWLDAWDIYPMNYPKILNILNPPRRQAAVPAPTAAAPSAALTQAQDGSAATVTAKPEDTAM